MFGRVFVIFVLLIEKNLRFEMVIFRREQGKCCSGGIFFSEKKSWRTNDGIGKFGKSRTDCGWECKFL